MSSVRVCSLYWKCKYLGGCSRYTYIYNKINASWPFLQIYIFIIINYCIIVDTYLHTETTGYFPTTTTAKPTLHMTVTYSTTGIIKCLLILLFYSYIPLGQLLDQYHRVAVDSTSRDERCFPLTQYITNGGISRAMYTITHFKHHHRVLQLISNRMKSTKVQPSAEFGGWYIGIFGLKTPCMYMY